VNRFTARRRQAVRRRRTVALGALAAVALAVGLGVTLGRGEEEGRGPEGGKPPRRAQPAPPLDRQVGQLMMLSFEGTDVPAYVRDSLRLGRASGAATQVEIRIGDHVIATEAVVPANALVRKIAITAAQLGSGDMVEVRLVANSTFVPALEPGAKSNDTRELGVRVFYAFVQPAT